MWLIVSYIFSLGWCEVNWLLCLL